MRTSIPTLLISALLAASLALAGESLPVISPPVGFDEGTETQLRAEQMGEILPWAQNSETTLKELLETTRSFSYREARDTLIRGIQDLVLASAPKRTELLMRYVLNRALKVLSEVETQADSTQPGVIDLQVRMLRASVGLALKYYQSDLAYLNGRFIERKTDLAGLPYAFFGVEYAGFLMNLDQSLFDASAQYSVAVMTLGLLQWDLYRDQDRLLYAPVIAKIDRFLKLVPQRAPSLDADSVKWLRRIKKVHQDSVSQTTELMKNAGKRIPVIGPESTTRNPPPAGNSDVAAQANAVIATCSTMGNSESKRKCYVEMILSSKMAERTFGLPYYFPACQAISNPYYSAACLEAALGHVISGTNFYPAVKNLCSIPSNDAQSRVGCFEQVLYIDSLAIDVKSCQAMKSPYTQATCFAGIVDSMVAQYEIPLQRALRICEMGGQDDRVACYRVYVTQLDGVIINAAKTACAAISSIYDASLCYKNALTSALPKR